MPLVENTKLVAGDATGTVVFICGGGVESNALTMLGDPAAIEAFSVSFTVGTEAVAPKIGIALAACPKIVSGFCTEVVELVDFGVANESCAKLNADSTFSDDKFSLAPTVATNEMDFSASTFSFVVFGGLLNENTGSSTLAASILEIGGTFSTIGFVAGLNVNDVCGRDLLTLNAIGDGDTFEVAIDIGLIETVDGVVVEFAMLTFEFNENVGPNDGFGNCDDGVFATTVVGAVLNDENGVAVDLLA